MRREYEEAFQERRKEWTARKHRILKHYFHVAATKLRKFGNKLVFVDGYAGANQYGDETEGSTRIMIATAEHASNVWGTQVAVHACEANPVVRKQLKTNLASHIATGLLTVHDSPHAASVASIREMSGRAPLVVFLDPNKPTQMTIDGDIAPWADRPRTDVLGLYFGEQVHRIIEGAKKRPDMEKAAKAVAGDDWQERSTSSKVFTDFVEHLSAVKPNAYVGMYRLKKQESGHIVYGIFGISGHIEGYHLLSDAVARDFSRIEEAKRQRETGSLFEGDPELDEELKRFQRLQVLARPVLIENPTIDGKELAKRLLDEQRDELFGQFAEKDYNRVIRQIRSENEGAGNA